MLTTEISVDKSQQIILHIHVLTMADPLYNLLFPHIANGSGETSIPGSDDTTGTKYLGRLATLPLSALSTTELQSLGQASHSTLLSIQALSTRSSKTVINSADQLKSLNSALPRLAKNGGDLRDGISVLDKEIVSFAKKYSRTGENEVLERRKKALLMSRNADRLSDVLELPTLLASAISASASQGSSSNTAYASALDLHSNIKRLQQIYSNSELLKSIHNQAEDSMREMKSHLITSLRAQSIKLASGMRTIGWLRRIAPELGVGAGQGGISSEEGAFGALFLLCRLSNLLTMLDALEPLRVLADQESERRLSGKEQVTSGNAWSGGQQTERYLKRYIEIFREQSFSIISMFKSIFPAKETLDGESLSIQFKSLGLKSPVPDMPTSDEGGALQQLPSALATFPLHLIELLSETLKKYLPNVRDKSSRESLLTQVLYCAGSLGRLGGDFGMILVMMGNEEDDDDDDSTPEWVSVMKKHRVLAGRLEQLAGGAGSQSRASLKAGDDDFKRVALKA